MNKIALTVAALPALAVGMFAATDNAEARMRFGIGFGLQNNWAHQQVFSNRVQADRRIEREREIARERVIERRQAAAQQYKKAQEAEAAAARRAAAARASAAAAAAASKPVLAYSDNQGRQYDLKTKVWFDGQASCYTGKYGFTFRDGNWYYGGAQWTEQQDGEWAAKSASPAVAADCMSVPLFAQRIELSQSKFARIEPAQQPTQTVGKQVPTSVDLAPVLAPKAEAAPVEQPKVEVRTTEAKEKPAIKVEAKTVSKIEGQVKSALSDVCKKYFPSVGQMLDVPCE